MRPVSPSTAAARRHLAVLMLGAAFAAFAPTPAMAQAPDAAPAAEATKALADSVTPAPGDPMALLASCDADLSKCQEHRKGMPYLAAAYMALWVIILAVLFAWRRSQLKLRAELRDLREELERALGAAGR